jgi:large subunit ribosomal protein L3
MKLKRLKLMGKKRGMIQRFDDKGHAIACTVIEVQPNIITQVKTKETDGYNAIQLGFDEIKTNDPRTAEKRVGKPLMGHFKKANTAPFRHLSESALDSVDGYATGQAVDLEKFSDVEYLDVTAQSKGKGYQGVIKRHHFAGGLSSHGSGFHRHGGSTGMRSTPGRVFPGQKMPGHMGAEMVTVQNLKVSMIDAQENVLVVEGAVPGPRDGLVYISAAKKVRQKVEKGRG